MRILHIITGAAFIVAFVMGCSKTPSQPISTSSAAMQDLGVVSITDATSECFAIGPNKSCTLTGAAGSNGMTKFVLAFQETNADKTVRIHDPETYFIKAGRQAMICSGGIRFTVVAK